MQQWRNTATANATFHAATLSRATQVAIMGEANTTRFAANCFNPPQQQSWLQDTVVAQT
jgi:hypothetical protein